MFRQFGRLLCTAVVLKNLLCSCSRVESMAKPSPCSVFICDGKSMFLGGSCGILSTGLGLRLLSASVRMYVLVQRTLVWYVPGTRYRVPSGNALGRFCGRFCGSMYVTCNKVASTASTSRQRNYVSVFCVKCRESAPARRLNCSTAVLKPLVLAEGGQPKAKS